VFAWGNGRPQEDRRSPIWGCHYAAVLPGLVNVAPVGWREGGDAKWANRNLTGAYGNGSSISRRPIRAVRRLRGDVDGAGHVVRGAAFNNYAENLPISYHEWSRSSQQTSAARCARVIP